MTAQPDQIAAPTMPTPREVGEWYDRTDSFCQLISGDSFHYGLWTLDDGNVAVQPRDLVTQAQDRMTDFFADLLWLEPGDRLLDVGCGHGSPAIRAAKRTGVHVTGCSVSQAQIAEATRRATTAGLGGQVHFEHGDAMDLPYANGSFDAVWALDSFPHLNDPVRGLRELGWVARPGASILVTFYTQRVPATDAELALCRDGFAFCPLPTGPEVFEHVERSGLILDQFHDLSRNIALTSTMYGQIYHGNRARIGAEFGSAFLDNMDTAMPDVLAFLTDKTGYVVCLLRTPDPAEG